MSNLQTKSKVLKNAAQFLHDNGYYVAVAHSAYYCCVQLMYHIWFYTFRKTEDDLYSELNAYNSHTLKTGERTMGVHEFLIRVICDYIYSSTDRLAYKDSRIFSKNIWELKILRTNADYSDNPFNMSDSERSLLLSNKILAVLKKY
jgi:hypothetical protein